jgi:hypothetical protein
MIGSTYRLPCIAMPRIDMPRLDSTCRFHVLHFHVTYITIRDGPARHVSDCHVTRITTRDGTGTTHIHFPLLITPSTQYLSSQFKYSRVMFQITLDESLIDTSLQSLLEYLVFLPLHLPIFPLHLVVSKPPLPLAYMNPATPRTHDVGMREAAFF